MLTNVVVTAAYVLWIISTSLLVNYKNLRQSYLRNRDDLVGLCLPDVSTMALILLRVTA
jgi:hypothetical protein